MDGGIPTTPTEHLLILETMGVTEHAGQMMDEMLAQVTWSDGGGRFLKAIRRESTLSQRNGC
ncbi:MAG: hypothetical protein F4Z73_03660 [Synechococcus sp. SB0668_bin_13]|nr:hypothetical protein [Synechococcus sp. SB0668_bin_13]